MNRRDKSHTQYEEFWSSNDMFGLRIPTTQFDLMIDQARRSFPSETGGIIIGSYTTGMDCAVVESITGAPEDSGFGQSWFRRGTKGLVATLKRAWKKKKYYLGEWHVHPNGVPAPSTTDEAQMTKIIASTSYDCERPVLVILALTSTGKWRIGVFVFLSSSTYVELSPLRDDYYHQDFRVE